MLITIHSSCYQQIVEHCQGRYPEEACGVLFGVIEEKHDSRSVTVISSIAIANIHANSSVAFQFDPEGWVHAYYIANRQGLEVVGIYHSHPSEEAEPSKHDLQGFIDQNIIYAILSLKQKDSPQIRIYRIFGQNQFINYPLMLT